MNQLSSLAPSTRDTVLHAIEMLCQVFWGPSASLCEKLFEQELFKEIEPLKQMVCIDPSNTIEDIETFIGNFKGHEDLFNDLETTYVSLFISNRKGYIVPLYQSCYEYENAPIMGPSAIEMRKRLDEAGLSVKPNEPPDHLCIELEYLYFLCDKGWADEDSSLMAEAVSFTKHTMAPWVLSFQKKLMMRSEASFYSMFTSIMIALLNFISKAD